MSTNYDAIFQEYQIVNTGLPVKKYAEEFTFLRLLGDVSGLTVLDLACGEGKFTRKIKRLGAQRVVGVDISEKMVMLASEAEQQHPLGIEYTVCDAADLDPLPTFDIISAAFLLNYASTKYMLLCLCRTIQHHLKPDGKFVSCTNATPLFPPNNPERTRKYGYLLKCLPPLEAGDSLEYLFFDGDNSFRIINYHWPRETYEWALGEAGFKKVTWHRPVISPDGIKIYGEKFWQDFLEQPNFICIECT